MLPFYTLKTIREINKLIYNCIKRIKYLGINLTKAMKATLNMGENNSKWNNWQRINLKNTQAAHAAQYRENKQPNQKVGRKPKHTFFSQKTYRWLKNTWKDTQHHSLVRCKSKLQWGITSHQSEWPSKSKILQTINPGEDVEKKNPLALLVGR